MEPKCPPEPSNFFGVLCVSVKRHADFAFASKYFCVGFMLKYFMYLQIIRIYRGELPWGMHGCNPTMRP